MQHPRVRSLALWGFLEHGDVARVLQAEILTKDSGQESTNLLTTIVQSSSPCTLRLFLATSAV
jgi:hypothetical protein